MAERGYPEPTVGALILDGQGRILLVKGSKHKQRYVIPGGHIEIGEKIEEALQREVKEETGLEIHDVRLLGLQDCLFNEFYHRRKHFVYIDFVCRAESNQVQLNEESEEYLWAAPQEALQLALDTYTRRLIQEYLRGDASPYSQRVLYDYYE